MIQTEPGTLADLTRGEAGEVLPRQPAAFVAEARAHRDHLLPPLAQTLADLQAELREPSCPGWGIREAGRLVACHGYQQAHATPADGYQLIHLAKSPQPKPSPAVGGVAVEHAGILATTPEGGSLCLRAFCQEGFAELGPHDHPDVTLDCIALARSLPAWQTADYPSVRAVLSVSVQRLAAAGADFFACPDNTAHLALEQPGPDLALPGLNIAGVVADQAARDGRKRVGILGTRYTMDGPVYPQALAARQVAAETPSQPDRVILDQIIQSELVNGVFTH